MDKIKYGNLKIQLIFFITFIYLFICMLGKGTCDTVYV